MEPFAGVTIFVNHGPSMPQNKHRRNRGAIFLSHPDLNLVAHAFDQVSEPGLRLAGQLVTFRRK
jgi:hypothetical protein